MPEIRDSLHTPQSRPQSRTSLERGKSPLSNQTPQPSKLDMLRQRAAANPETYQTYDTRDYIRSPQTLPPKETEIKRDSGCWDVASERSSPRPLSNYSGSPSSTSLPSDFSYGTAVTAEPVTYTGGNGFMGRNEGGSLKPSDNLYSEPRYNTSSSSMTNSAYDDHSRRQSYASSTTSNSHETTATTPDIEGPKKRRSMSSIMSKMFTNRSTSSSPTPKKSNQQYAQEFLTLYQSHPDFTLEQLENKTDKSSLLQGLSELRKQNPSDNNLSAWINFIAVKQQTSATPSSPSPAPAPEKKRRLSLSASFASMRSEHTAKKARTQETVKSNVDQFLHSLINDTGKNALESYQNLGTDNINPKMRKAMMHEIDLRRNILSEQPFTPHTTQAFDALTHAHRVLAQGHTNSDLGKAQDSTYSKFEERLRNS